MVVRDALETVERNEVDGVVIVVVVNDVRLGENVDVACDVAGGVTVMVEKSGKEFGLETGGLLKGGLRWDFGGGSFILASFNLGGW